MDRKRQFLVPVSRKGQRLDLFLTNQLPGYSRARVKRLIEAGKATVEGRQAKAHQRLVAGNQVEVCLPPAGESALSPQFIPLDIIYEDKEILVVNKPAGLVVHPVRAGQKDTLLNALLFQSIRLSSIGAPLRRGVVHRLDKDTSGLVVVAKSDRAHLRLSSQFRERKVEKEYRALVRDHPPQEQGELTYPVGRDLRRRTKMKVKYIGGREAHTLYQVLETFRDCSYLQLLLKTGRTHQIRVHLSQLGCPVLGDTQYDPGGKEKAKSLGAARQMLHACRLKFSHPITEKTLEFTSALPQDMEKVLTVLRKEKGSF